MRGRGRLSCAAALLGGVTLLAGCGDVNAPVAGSTPSSTPTSVRMGEQQEVVPGLAVRVSISSTGGDERQTWLNVTVSYENRSAGDLPLPPPTLHCAQADAPGEPRDLGARREQMTWADTSAGRVLEMLLPPGTGGEPLTECRAPSYVALGDARWQLGASDLEYLDAELARDPGRPYRWVDADDRFSSGYQVVLVPGASAAEALSALAPVRRKVSQERFWAVRVAEHDDGVVLFTWGLVSDERVVALSRISGLAASYGNTVEGDDHVLVARDGRVVRSFDPFLAQTYDKSRPLPEERGLDLENDTGPAAWTLLERLTALHVTRDWLLDAAHPAYLLGDR